MGGTPSRGMRNLKWTCGMSTTGAYGWTSRSSSQRLHPYSAVRELPQKGQQRCPSSWAVAKRQKQTPTAEEGASRLLLFNQGQDVAAFLDRTVAVLPIAIAPIAITITIAIAIAAAILGALR